jgi:hypothetical protein
MRISSLTRVRQAYNMTLPKMSDREYRQTVYAKAGLYLGTAAGLSWIWQGLTMLFRGAVSYNYLLVKQMESEHQHRKDKE